MYLDQQRLTDFSVTAKMSNIVTASHKDYWALQTVAGETKELNFQLHLILTNINVNSHIWASGFHIEKKNFRQLDISDPYPQMQPARICWMDWDIGGMQGGSILV